MGIVLKIIHMLITIGLIAGIMIHTTKSEGLGGTIGGGSDTLYRGSGAKGFQAFIEKMLIYLAVAFLVTSILIGLVIPKFFG
jgi:preprotein translocase subunit SecG